jgi:Ca2+-binding RTX toxin-like protein
LLQRRRLIGGANAILSISPASRVPTKAPISTSWGFRLRLIGISYPVPVVPWTGNCPGGRASSPGFFVLKRSGGALKQLKQKAAFAGTWAKQPPSSLPSSNSLRGKQMKTIKIGNSTETFVADKANTLYTMAEGKVINMSTPGYGIDATGEAKGRTLDIDGTIDAFGTGISLGAGYGTGAAYAVNLEIGESAHVSGGIHGVVTSGRGNVLRNAGEITGLQSGVSFDSGTMTIINRGEISGGTVGIFANLGAEAVVIRNTGSISGGDTAIYGGYVGGHSDKVVNSGEINGDVRLLAGDDIFIFKSGVVNGNIYGGEGDDLYVVKSLGAFIYEASGEGDDVVRTSISWTIGDNVEGLQLTGKKDLNGFGAATANRLTGNSGDNELFGRAGDDTLRGGAGNDMLTGDQDADIFIFAKGAGKDTVTDFEAGIDEIRLGGLKGAEDFADMLENHIKQKGDDLWITYGDDTVVLKGTTEAELQAGDFIFN